MKNDTARPRSPPLLSGGSALFLDFDGTLVELAPRPELVSVPEYLPALLDALQQQLQGAVALITGRALSTVDCLVRPLQLPGAGLHGAELRRAGDRQTVPAPARAAALQLERKLTARFRAEPRIVVESKPGAVALHYRQAPERMLECDTAMQALASDFPELELIRGSMVIEARPLGASKGHALRRLLHSACFAGRQPVVVGDDRTDEEAFTAAQELHGHAIKVGSGPSVARFRLPGVTGVHAWLSQSALALGAR